MQWTEGNPSGDSWEQDKAKIYAIRGVAKQLERIADAMEDDS